MQVEPRLWGGHPVVLTPVNHILDTPLDLNTGGSAVTEIKHSDYKQTNNKYC